jgi:hypothetical protein
MSVRAMGLLGMVVPSMFQKVALVLARSAVLEVAQVGVERVAVEVANLQALWAWS